MDDYGVSDEDWEESYWDDRVCSYPCHMCGEDWDEEPEDD